MITKVDALTEIRAILADQPATTTTKELVEWCDSQLFITKNALAKDKEKRDAAKAAAGPDELCDVIYSILSNVPQSIPELMKKIDGDGISAPLMSVRLTTLIKDGKAKKEKVMVPKSETSPAHSYMVYTRA